MALMILSFIRHFPNMMPYNVLLTSIAFFAVGWVIQAMMLKK